MKEKDIAKGVGFAILATIIWSGNFIAARGVYQDIPPISLSFYRWATASLVLLPFTIRAAKAEWPVIKKHFNYFFWLALTGVSLFNTLVYIGGHYTSAINLALIGTTSSPIMANILARVFLKERIGWQKIIGMALCIAGLLYLLSKGHWNNLLHLRFSRGDVWVLLAALSFAIYTILAKRKPAGISPLNFLFISFSLGTVLLIPFFIGETLYAKPYAWSSTLVGTVLYLGICASIISFFLWNKSLQSLGAGRTSLFGNLIPVFSSLEAVLILREEFTLPHVVSMLLVFAGLVVANLSLLTGKGKDVKSER